MQKLYVSLATAWLVCCMTGIVFAEDANASKLAAAGKRSVGLAGDWRLLLPAGFEYAVKLVPYRDGYRLETKGIATGGPYAVRGNKLVYVGSDERRRFEWLIRSAYLLTLGNHDAANGANYAGAVLFRPSPAATLASESAAPNGSAKVADHFVPREHPSKVLGPLGFTTLGDALARWDDIEPAHRWTGELAKKVDWDQIERIQVLDLAMHLRSIADIDKFLKPVLAEAVLIESWPERFSAMRQSGHHGVMLQSLVEFRHGESALVTIGNSFPNWLVIEYQGRVGLAMLKQRRGE